MFALVQNYNTGFNFTAAYGLRWTLRDATRQLSQRYVPSSVVIS
jgi:hypothetical protein